MTSLYTLSSHDNPRSLPVVIDELGETRYAYFAVRGAEDQAIVYVSSASETDIRQQTRIYTGHLDHEGNAVLSVRSLRRVGQHHGLFFYDGFNIGFTTEDGYGVSTPAPDWEHFSVDAYHVTETDTRLCLTRKDYAGSRTPQSAGRPVITDHDNFRWHLHHLGINRKSMLVACIIAASNDISNGTRCYVGYFDQRANAVLNRIDRDHERSSAPSPDGSNIRICYHDDNDDDFERIIDTSDGNWEQLAIGDYVVDLTANSMGLLLIT